MFQFDFFSRSTCTDERNRIAHDMPAASEFVPVEEPVAPVDVPAVSDEFAVTLAESAFTAEQLVSAVEPEFPAAEAAPCEPVAEPDAPITAAEAAPTEATAAAEPVLAVTAPAPEAAPWQPPKAGGYTAPTVSALKSMLGYAENLLISLNNRSSLERKSTRDLSVTHTRNYVTESYETALNNHNIVCCMGKLVFPLPGIWVTEGDEKMPLVGTLTPTYTSFNWRFAYTEDVAFTSCFDAACYEAAAPSEEDAAAALNMTPAEYLTGCGYRVQSISTDPQPLPAVLNDLVQQIADAVTDPLVAGFFQSVRSNIPLNKPGHYEMTDAAPASKDLLCSLLQRMGKLGFFTYLSVNKFSDIVNYSLSHSDRCIQFLNGLWLEFYTADICRSVVNSIAREYGLPAQVCANVVLTDPADSEVPCHELDCAFTIGGLFFWIEAKSSSRNVNYDKYRIRGQLLGVIPDQFLLLNADLDQSEVEGLAWLYPYHLANCSSFAETLRSMVTTALDAAKTTGDTPALAA